jgi:serine protease AprX
MAVRIPRGLVESILLGPLGDRRQLQDSPILADVWIAFAEAPGEPKELLITPDKLQTAGAVAIELDECIYADRNRPAAPARKSELAHFAYLQGVVAAKLYFDELLRVIVPRTKWWKSSRNRKEIQVYLQAGEGRKKLQDVLASVQKMIRYWSAPNSERKVPGLPSALDRYAAIAGIILWAGRAETEMSQDGALSEQEALARAIERGMPLILEILADLLKEILTAEAARETQDQADSGRKKKTRNDGAESAPLVYQISLNRDVAVAIARSVGAVKADAANSLFKVDCSEIGWAVLDSGIDGSHPAFAGHDGETRVKASFDFSNYREIVSLDNLRIFRGDDQELKLQKLKKLLHGELKNKPQEKDAIEHLTTLAADVKFKRSIHWDLVEPFIEVHPAARPRTSDHGTHVAGIIGASKDGPASMEAAKKKGGVEKDSRSEYVDGMCPDIQLYDFRVLSEATRDVKDTEFAVIAALQYIRHLNARHDFVTIHGANLSLSIQHDVHNFACGRTPVCEESEKLVSSGVVVVAAAGNYGYQSYVTKEGSYEGYAAASITDPGNADGVITVGATHRYSPHTYGVSFFSSRGPTGDGRSKPDLVAPGERIHAPFRDNSWDDLDGTSMAAPHVSGAAAMLMARYSELIGQPRRIKEILCQSATDLGRERNFQGHGMLDVLRAFQSI